MGCGRFRQEMAREWEVEDAMSEPWQGRVGDKHPPHNSDERTQQMAESVSQQTGRTLPNSCKGLWTEGNGRNSWVLGDLHLK